MAEINVDEQIEQAHMAMEHAENALMDSGFSPEQWEMIKDYIAQSITHSQWQIAKAWQRFPSPIK